MIQLDFDGRADFSALWILSQILHSQWGSVSQNSHGLFVGTFRLDRSKNPHLSIINTFDFPKKIYQAVEPILATVNTSGNPDI
jgi:hypothetical protein